MKQARHILRRRGSIYAMVLGISMLITIIGIGALATSRVTTRSANVSVEWQEAGAIAFSAVEHAIAKLNADAVVSPDMWRDGYLNDAVGFRSAFGNGVLRWVLVDEDDGNIGDDYAENLRLYGVGQVGKTLRVYSVQLQATGDGLDALKTAMHSSGGITLGGPTIVTGGTASTNGNLTNSTNLRGGAGTEVAGVGGTAAVAKVMPPAGVFETYMARATPIATSNASTGNFEPGTLTAAANPYGAENSDGIYYLRLPDAVSVVTIKDSRFKGTLLVEASATNTNQTLVIDSGVYWESNSLSFPILITKNVKTVTVRGKVAPYNASYPSELCGLIHTIGTTTVNLENSAFIRGCLIVEGEIVTSGTVGITANPAFFTNPPMGYTKGNRILPSPGTWKWDLPHSAAPIE